MSTRGRGYGGYGVRGSYSGGRGSYRGSYRGSNRGSYESRGGRGGGGGGGYSYNNDSRYSSSSSNRYSNRDRMDDSYKKAYRSEASSGYSNRDYGGRSGSPERKRMRIEGSSSDRRSHDGGSHYGSSYGSREYGSERRSYGGGEERRRSPSRDGFRKSSGGMGPPREPLRSSMRPRAPRRSFRGRTMRSRTLYRGAARSRSSFSMRRFADRSLSYNRAFKTVKSRSPMKKEDVSSTEEEWDADEKDELTEEKKELKLKSPKPEDEEEEEEEATSEAEAGDGGEETDKEPDAASDSAPRRRVRPYVHLLCVHCKEKYQTFSSYAKHLVSSKHRASMSAVARHHKAQLLRMRVDQRGAQRDLEAAAGAELASRTTFCLVCRLNHRTTRHAHNLTDTHRAMKRFLMPFCRVCRLSFRSPMIYEHHVASLDHLKRKASQAQRRAASPKAEASGDEGMDVDLENFMTLDSVGDVDEVEDDDSSGEKKDDVSTKEPKKEINIGSEHIKKMEVWYCELCRVYLPTTPGSSEEADSLRRHCRLRIHLSRYVQHRDTRTLRKHAERIHRQLHQQKEDGKEASENPEKVKSENSETTEEAKKLENGGSEDKLWADVDKDIGEFLREVDPQGNEDSGDEEDLGRYDKFRKSDKIKNGDTAETEANAADTPAEKNSSEVNTPA